jgi:flagellar basal body-associated protein FliL
MKTITTISILATLWLAAYLAGIWLLNQSPAQSSTTSRQSQQMAPYLEELPYTKP